MLATLLTHQTNGALSDSEENWLGLACSWLHSLKTWRLHQIRDVHTHSLPLLFWTASHFDAARLIVYSL
jgi:hypothetical protein